MEEEIKNTDKRTKEMVCKKQQIKMEYAKNMMKHEKYTEEGLDQKKL